MVVKHKLATKVLSNYMRIQKHLFLKFQVEYSPYSQEITHTKIETTVPGQ